MSPLASNPEIVYFECICGNKQRSQWNKTPDGWACVPDNVSVYLCAECAKPAWELFSVEVKKIVKRIVKRMDGKQKENEEMA